MTLFLIVRMAIYNHPYDIIVTFEVKVSFQKFYRLLIDFLVFVVLQILNLFHDPALFAN